MKKYSLGTPSNDAQCIFCDETFSNYQRGRIWEVVLGGIKNMEGLEVKVLYENSANGEYKISFVYILFLLVVMPIICIFFQVVIIFVL